MGVSLVMPTYNKLPRLRLALASLSRQSWQPDRWELLLVDDGSTDGTTDYLQSLRLPAAVRYIAGTRGGRAAARNRGLALARHPLVVFVDDDMLLPPEFVEAHAGAQQRGPCVVHGRIVNISALKFFADPAEGRFYPELRPRSGAASRLLAECITERDVLQDFDERVRCNRRVTALEKVIEKLLGGQAPGPRWLGFTGGNVSAPRRWLQQAGGFDEAFGLDWGSEDLELGYRLARDGRPFCYDHAAVGFHMAHYRFDFDVQQRRTSRHFASKHEDQEVLAVTRFIDGELDSRGLARAFAELHAAPHDPAKDELQAQQQAEVIQLFDEVATDYDQIGPPLFSPVGQALVRRVKIDPGASVLDVACGRGAVLLPAAARATGSGAQPARVVGIDLSARMLAALRADLQRAGLEGVTLQQMDAGALGLGDASFDRALCGMSLPFFPRPRRALRELRRVLRPGGRVGVSLFHQQNSWWTFIEQLARPHVPEQLLDPVEEQPGSLETPGRLEAALSDAGFANVEVVPEEIPVVYRDAGQWWRSLWSHGARQLMEAIPEERLERFQDEARAALAGRAEAGGIHFAVGVLLATAVR